ncbi:MAG: hypothetical protein Q9172_004745 [Xanthocarpia lactea]
MSVQLDRVVHGVEAGSLTSGGSRQFPDGNKRLAILGNTALHLVLAGDWYGGAAPRGTTIEIPAQWVVADCTNSAAFDRIRQQVGSNQNLNQIGNAKGLNAFVILAGAQAGQGTIPPATMAATVEAIIGAVYLDSNSMSTVMGVMSTLGLTADPATGDLSAAW